jgi:hypothetical protein
MIGSPKMCSLRVFYFILAKYSESMILKRQGAGEFRELTAQEVQDLYVKVLGKTPDNFKRPLEFILLGKRGKVNGRVEQTYTSSTSLHHTFTVREGGTTVEYAYAHRLENVRNGGLISQKLMSSTGEPWPQKLGLQFRRTKKKIICSLDELDRALYLLIYPDCDVSPFRGKRPALYEHVRKDERAKVDLLAAKEKVALQNQILNVIDESTLRAYLTAGGNNEVHLMGGDEVRSVVYHEAMKDPEKFKARISSSSMNLRADVNSFIQAGLLAKQSLGKEVFWKINYGEQRGDLLCKLSAGLTDEVKPLVQHFFDNPSVFEEIKHAYFKTISPEQPVSKKVVQTLGENEALGRVLDYDSRGLLMYVAAHRKVVLKDPETGKKRAGTSDLCVVEPGQDWKEALAICIEKDPQLEALIEL